MKNINMYMRLLKEPPQFTIHQKEARKEEKEKEKGVEWK